MIQYLNVFYDISYLCGTVFLVGSWLRYDYGQTARLIQPDAG
ncbi:Respiratory nitrate reductase 2 gamma chain [Klebsiella pneumoniae]|nr:Respiratory nitrate reductase 2 gamma chain [Klebsiella pneumoniae]